MRTPITLIQKLSLHSGSIVEVNVYNNHLIIQKHMDQLDELFKKIVRYKIGILINS